MLVLEKSYAHFEKTIFPRLYMIFSDESTYFRKKKKT